MITVTKKDLIELGYGTSFAADIIREAKKLMISKGHTYYQTQTGQGSQRSCGRIVRDYFY